MILPEYIAKRADDFRLAVIPTDKELLASAIEFIRDNLDIDDVFTEKQVDEFCAEWAQDNGWTKTE